MASPKVLTAAMLLLMTVSDMVMAQQRPRVWDIALGTSIGQLPNREFVDPVCGSNGGPPGQFLAGFGEFQRCAKETESGLREVAFVYDDELEYVARARRDPLLIGRYAAMQVLGQPVTLSFLIDDDGRVQGYRIITDPRAPISVRLAAATLAVHLKGRFGSDRWDCIELPRVEGETPIGAQFIKERCEKMVDGIRHVVESRYYYKAGQAMLDPRTQQPMTGAFESSARLEVVRLASSRP